MALPFFSTMGGLMPMLPDGGIYDPESGLSYIGAAMQLGPGVNAPPEAAEFIKSTPGVTIDGYSTNSPSVTPTIVSTPGVTIDGYSTNSPSVTPTIVSTPTIKPPIITPPTVTPTTVTNPVIPPPPPSGAADDRNAREFLLGSLREYFSRPEDSPFLADLEKIIDQYVVEEYDADTIRVLLPQTEPFKKRFAGNEARIKAGLGALSPADYLQAENQYNEILKRFKLGDLAKRDTFSTLIGGQVSAAELTDRVVNVYDRIRNADPALRAELDRVEGLGGNITDADFAKALLTGAEGANELKRKISTAEITAEARIRSKRLEESGFLPGLSVANAEQLQRLGVTREQARAGFEQIALTQPRLTQLSEIYTGETPEATELQTELEAEQFQGLQSQRRRRLAEQEQTAFMGQSGTAAGVSLGRRRKGQF
jgi:hypothetical protein